MMIRFLLPILALISCDTARAIAQETSYTASPEAQEFLRTAFDDTTEAPQTIDG